MLEPEDGGILVDEGPAAGAPIVLDGVTVAAFIGPAPRGPVHLPIAIGSIAEFRARFGAPGQPGNLEQQLADYFANGGERAIVVRVPSGEGYGQIVLPGSQGNLTLRAANPGVREYLRAAVDYDGPGDDPRRFNLVIQRVRSPGAPLVEQQEIWSGISVDPGSQACVADVLQASRLVRLCGSLPGARPSPTVGGVCGAATYVDSRATGERNVPMTDYDLVGCAQEGTGLFALEQVPVVDLLCLVPADPGGEIGPVALFAAERYCAARNTLLLIDPPRQWHTVTDVVRSQRERGLASANVATYFPRPGAADQEPDRGPRGSLLGALAGALARRDARPHSDALLLRSRRQPATALSPGECALLARLGVNAIVSRGPALLCCMGEVTLARPGAGPRHWEWLATRRLALRIVGAAARGTRWAAVRPDAGQLRQTVHGQLDAYLRSLTRRGLLAAVNGESPYALRIARAGACRPGVSLAFTLWLGLPGAEARSMFLVEQSPREYRVSEAGWQQSLALAS